jgi:hypothetical protein
VNARWTRVVRGLLAASMSTFVAAFSHAVSGGGAPSVAALSLAVAFSSIVCVALAGRGLSLWRIGASVAASQILFHTLFSLIAAPTARATATAGAHSGHDMTAMFSPGSAASDVSIDAAMLAGHIVAAVVTFAAIVWGERAARGLATTAALQLSRLVSLLLPAHSFVRAPLRPGRIFRIEAPAPLERLLASLWHRGPPALAA